MSGPEDVVSRLPRISCWLLLVALAGTTCCSGPGGGPRGAGDVEADAGSRDEADAPRPRSEPPARFGVPQQLGLGWAEVNHRIARWRVGLRGEEPQRTPEAVEAAFVGGTFSTGERAEDEAILRFGWRRVETRRLGVARRRVEATLGPDGIAEGERTWSRTELGLSGWPRVVALVRGVSFDTTDAEPAPNGYDPAHGWTSRGLGAAVEVVADAGGEVTLSWRLRFEPGTAHDREKLNGALSSAEVAGRLEVLLVGLADTPTRAGATSFSLEGPPPEFGEDRGPEPAPEEARRIPLDGASGGPAGFAGLSAFDLELTPRTDCEGDGDCPAGETCGSEASCTRAQGPPGYYVRELGVGVEREGYDPETGRATFLVDGDASNASSLVAYYALRAEVSARVRWIQAPGAQRRRTLEHRFGAGATEVPLAPGEGAGQADGAP